MNKEFYTARIDPTVADLIPQYMENRRKEVERFSGYLASGDFEKIAQLAHRMVGVGTPYGFPHISNLAKIIRESALSQDRDIVESLIREYGDYLANVKVVVEQPR